MRCKHGMEQAWCALCNPPVSKYRKRPNLRSNITAHGAASVSNLNLDFGRWGIVHTGGFFKKYRFTRISDQCKFVHINGHPFLWVITTILEKCPHLQILQITPKREHRISQTHRDICKKRGVELRIGYWCPELAWGENDNRSPYYQAQQQFFKKLQGEQADLFKELLDMGFTCALMTERYFCLKGEGYIPQWQIGVEHGYAGTVADRIVGEKIGAVIYYLDSTFEAIELQKNFARNLKKQVIRLRAVLRNRATFLGEKERFKNQYRYDLNESFPLARLDALESILQKRYTEEFIKWREKYKRKYKLFSLRFGLEDGKYKTLKEVGDSLGYTKERIRQVELEVLGLLEIIDSDI